MIVRLRSTSVLVLSLTAATATTGQAVPQSDLHAVTGDTSRSLFGTGKRVLVGILDGGIDPNHPAVRTSIYASKDFSGSRTTDDDPTGAGHATGIAGLYVGHAGDYTGLVPRSGIINARVITGKDYTNDTMSGNGLFWALDAGAKVINLSYGNKLGDGPLTSKFNLMVDYASEQYGASIVAAAGNDNDTAVQQVPNGAYNGYGVGSVDASRFNTVSDFSNFALRSDRRSKPDLVAPGDAVERANANWEKGTLYSTGSGTSFSAPIVGGVLAQMTGYGIAARLPTDPRVLKAILLASADKVYDSDGSAWAPRHQFTTRKGALGIDQPLDDEQGAGRLDAVAAYRIYSKSRDSSTPVANWAFTSLKRFRTYGMSLGRLTAGQRVDTSIAWDYHVGRTDNGNRVVDAGDKFYESVPLADFALSLIKDGRVIATSDSLYDNTELLSYKITTAGNYTLEVYRHPTGGNRNETFALAAHVLNNPPSFRSIEDPTSLFASQSGGVSRSLDEPSGVSRSIEAVTAVPEPSSGLVLLIVTGIACGQRRRRRSK
jgi:hypothetical protein